MVRIATLLVVYDGHKTKREKKISHLIFSPFVFSVDIKVMVTVVENMEGETSGKYVQMINTQLYSFV